VPAKTIEWLMEDFGYETNSKGYRVLPPFVRVVQGDGLTLASLRGIYTELECKGLSADNVFCGMGGCPAPAHQSRHAQLRPEGERGLHQRQVEGRLEGSDGRPDEALEGGASRAAVRRRRLQSGPPIPPEENLLQPVFRNGKLLRKWDFTELIARSEREVPEYSYADVIAPMISGR